MASYDILQNDFSSGELSPLLMGRSNSELYNTGLLRCRNFMPMLPSGVRRRPGTRFLWESAASGIEIIPVKIGGKDYICALRFPTSGNTIAEIRDPENFAVVICECECEPFNNLSVGDLRFAVNKGVIWCVHNSIPVTCLTLDTTAQTLTLTQPTFTGGITFSEAGDYPSCITFNGGRLYLGATTNNPNTVYASRTPSGGTDRYTDFTFVDEDGQVYATNAFEVQDQELDGALWFVTSTRFLVGSRNAIFMDTGEIATPETFNLTPTLRDGSSSIVAKGMKNYVLYSGRAEKDLNMMVFDYNTQGYISVSLTQNSGHLLEDGIEDFVIAFMPDPIVWVLTKKHVLLSCTIYAGNSITTGWAEHTQSEGDPRDIRGLYVITRDDGIDELYLSVYLGKNAETDYCQVERLTMDNILDGSDRCYVDSAIEEASETGKTEWEYKWWYKGEVDLIGDNNALTPVAPDSEGKIYTRSVKNMQMGVPIDAQLGFLSKEQPSNGASSFANKRRVNRATIRTIKSFGGTIGLSDPDTEGETNYIEPQKLISRLYGAFKYNEAITLVDEDYVVNLNGLNKDNGEVYMKADAPLPLNILAVKLKVQLVET